MLDRDLAMMGALARIGVKRNEPFAPDAKMQAMYDAAGPEALDYMMDLGMDNIATHERALRDYAASRLDGLNWLQVYGVSKTKGAIFAFNLEGGAHPHDISTIVDKKGVAVRAGHHCAQPLMTHLGVTATSRAPSGLYNTTGEVDKLVEALELCHELFG